MTATELARDAVRDARQAAAYLAPQIVEDMARARLALAVIRMGDDVSAGVRLMRLEDGFAAIREILYP